ncbi:MAG: hypothetical protein Q7R79_03725, partial [bacterium]|nr:hypothetical protein [bacterium]
KINSGGTMRGLCLGDDCKKDWSEIQSSQWTTTGEAIHYTSGNVGIGTETPSSLLSLQGSPAELSLNSWGEKERRWKLYHDGVNESLGFWHDGGSNDAAKTRMHLSKEGLLTINGLRVATGAGPGLRYLTWDQNSQQGQWKAQVLASSLPQATRNGQTLYYDENYQNQNTGSGGWVPTDTLFNDGMRVGVGTINPQYTFDINGDVKFTPGFRYYKAKPARVTYFFDRMTQDEKNAIPQCGCSKLDASGWLVSCKNGEVADTYGALHPRLENFGLCFSYTKLESYQTNTCPTSVQKSFKQGQATYYPACDFFEKTLDEKDSANLLITGMLGIGTTNPLERIDIPNGSIRIGRMITPSNDGGGNDIVMRAKMMSGGKTKCQERCKEFDKRCIIGMKDGVLVKCSETTSVGTHCLCSANAPLPSEPFVQFFASNNKTTIKRGESTRLEWRTEHIQSASIDNGISTVDSPASGSVSISPQVTTTYVFTGKNSYFGDSVQSLTIVVEVTRCSRCENNRCAQKEGDTCNSGKECHSSDVVCNGTCNQNVCNAPEPNCGETTRGLNECGDGCQKTGSSCQIVCTVTTCNKNSGTANCGSVAGTNNCGNSCVYGQSACPPTTSPACTVNDYTCTAWGSCASNGKQSRTCTKKSGVSCSGGTSPETSQSCTRACTSGDYTCTNWGSCQPGGTQTRSCQKGSNINCSGGFSPVTQQTCSYCTNNAVCYKTVGQCNANGSLVSSGAWKAYDRYVCNNNNWNQGPIRNMCDNAATPCWKLYTGCPNTSCPF